MQLCLNPDFADVWRDPGKQFWIFLATILKKRIGGLEEEYFMIDGYAKKKF